MYRRILGRVSLCHSRPLTVRLAVLVIAYLVSEAIVRIYTYES